MLMGRESILQVKPCSAPPREGLGGRFVDAVQVGSASDADMKRTGD